MGNSLFKRYFSQKEVRILLVGLDASGKTTALYRLKLGEVVTTIPTIGFNVETVNGTLSHKAVNITAWDVGGRCQIRPLYRHYYPTTSGLVYMIDCADKERFGDAVEELRRFMKEDELRDIPILVLANKQDMAGVITPTEVRTKISEILTPADRKWAVFGVSAVHDLSGLRAAMDWLTSAMVENEAKHASSSWLPEMLKEESITVNKHKTKAPVATDEKTNASGLVESFKKLLWKFATESIMLTCLPRDMGNSLFKRLFSQKEVRIMFMGLDASGKTTTLYQLKLGEVVTTIPTIGFNVETISHKGVNITAWDVGGRDKMRPLYRHYFQNTAGLVYIFDCADKDRFGDSLEELKSFMGEDELRNTALLVLANKQDITGAITPTEVEKRVSEILTPIDRTWAVFGVSAVTDLSGLKVALDWLTSAIVENEAKHVVSEWTPALLKDDSTLDTKDAKEALESNKKGTNVCGLMESFKNLVWKFT
ncbi:uncharacterized protein LOC128210454 [Mya arenaria]|uniref:uncharacterized protein LOC128210454 n=1 Tax=Mya arenaria TaxID=6604 RepID=UPI0022DED6F6|nr:uncharacterized protein LOC128210454 [Mya arenaria]